MVGVFDGVDICELFVFYILQYYQEQYRRNKIGFSRNDGQACFENIGRPKAEHIRSNVIEIFKTEFKLNISSEANGKVVNFCDLTFDLTALKYQPYNKPNNDLF